MSKFVVEEETGCWVWSASLAGGYGQMWAGITTPAGHYRPQRAHRLAYEHFVGPVPHGLVLDHLCRVRACVNPAHLEPVTQRENLIRGVGFAAVNASKAACIHGHPFDDENTYLWRGQRKCRECMRVRVRDQRAA